MAGDRNAPEPGRLPVGLRLCQAYFAFAMLLALVFGFLCSPHMFGYDVSMARVLLLMAGGAVTLWLVRGGCAPRGRWARRRRSRARGSRRSTTRLSAHTKR